ncbi:hypothetical protein ACFVYC_09320 [Pseudarthrobacter sp. NPDC058329]|uniref:hypothetical protein n=1 Tax=Pseudarthrobacter sp. NPDC058329 TaxID=3346448 RepID=UPI0036DAC4F0
MGIMKGREVPPRWMFWLWLVAAIPLGSGVAWIVRNFSPVAPDALAVPVACAVVFTVAVAISSRRSDKRLSGNEPTAPIESGQE